MSGRRVSSVGADTHAGAPEPEPPTATDKLDNLLETLENDLVKNNFRKVEDWADKIGVKTIDIKIKKFDPFFNINTKQDLEEAKSILKKIKND